MIGIVSRKIRIDFGDSLWLPCFDEHQDRKVRTAERLGSDFE